MSAHAFKMMENTRYEYKMMGNSKFKATVKQGQWLHRK